MYTLYLLHLPSLNTLPSFHLYPTFSLFFCYKSETGTLTSHFREASAHKDDLSIRCRDDKCETASTGYTIMVVTKNTHLDGMSLVPYM